MFCSSSAWVEVKIPSQRLSDILQQGRRKRRIRHLERGAGHPHLFTELPRKMGCLLSTYELHCRCCRMHKLSGGLVGRGGYTPTCYNEARHTSVRLAFSIALLFARLNCALPSFGVCLLYSGSSSKIMS